jgi:hypothetical protein
LAAIKTSGIADQMELNQLVTAGFPVSSGFYSAKIVNLLFMSGFVAHSLQFKKEKTEFL